MATIKEFRDLEVWQLARDLAQVVFERVLQNPGLKDFPLKDQMNRSSGSVMDNIAEGFGRGGNKEFRQFLAVAKGSLAELESQLVRANDSHYLTNQEFDDMMSQVSRIRGKLIAFSNYLAKTEYKGVKYKIEEPSGTYVTESSSASNLEHETLNFEPETTRKT